MKKLTKILACAVGTATFATLGLVGCGGGGGGGGVDNLTSEQVTEMNGAVSATKDYRGSYTINETGTTVSSAYYEGEELESVTQESLAVVSYDYEGKQFLFYGDVPQGEVTVYNAKNEDGSWTQYLQAGYYKEANKYSHQAALVEDGFVYTNFKGESISVHFNSLTTALKSIFYADLEEAASITDPEDYSEFWSESYQTLTDQLISAYGTTATYENGGSSVSTEGDSVAYTFEIIGTPKKTPTITAEGQTIKLKNYKLTMDVTIVVVNGMLDEIRCEATQKFETTQNGFTIDYIATSNVVDKFTYEYDGTRAPTADELATFTVTDLTGGVVGDPDEDKVPDETVPGGEEVDFSKYATINAAKTALTADGWAVAEDFLANEEIGSLGGFGALKTVGSSQIAVAAMLFDSEKSAAAYLAENSEMVEVSDLKQSGCWVYRQFTISEGGNEGEDPIVPPILQGCEVTSSQWSEYFSDPDFSNYELIMSGFDQGAPAVISSIRNGDSFKLIQDQTYNGELMQTQMVAWVENDVTTYYVSEDGGETFVISTNDMSSVSDVYLIDVCKPMLTMLADGYESASYDAENEEYYFDYNGAKGYVKFSETGILCVNMTIITVDGEESQEVGIDVYFGNATIVKPTVNGSSSSSGNVDFSNVTTISEAQKMLESNGYIVELIPDEDLGNFPTGVAALEANKDDVSFVYAVLFNSEEDAIAYIQENASAVAAKGLVRSGCWIYAQVNSGSSNGGGTSVSPSISGGSYEYDIPDESEYVEVTEEEWTAFLTKFDSSNYSLMTNENGMEQIIAVDGNNVYTLLYGYAEGQEPEQDEIIIKITDGEREYFEKTNGVYMPIDVTSEVNAEELGAYVISTYVSVIIEDYNNATFSKNFYTGTFSFVDEVTTSGSYRVGFNKAGVSEIVINYTYEEEGVKYTGREEIIFGCTTIVAPTISGSVEGGSSNGESSSDSFVEYPSTGNQEEI